MELAGETVGEVHALRSDDGERPYEVRDLLTDRTYTWSGASAYVELHPDRQPGHIFRIAQGAP